MRTTNTTPLLHALRAAGFDSLAMELATLQDFDLIVEELRVEAAAMREYAGAAADADMLEGIVDAVTNPLALAA